MKLYMDRRVSVSAILGAVIAPAIQFEPLPTFPPAACASGARIYLGAAHVMFSGRRQECGKKTPTSTLHLSASHHT